MLTPPFTLVPESTRQWHCAIICSVIIGLIVTLIIFPCLFICSFADWEIWGVAPTAQIKNVTAFVKNMDLAKCLSIIIPLGGVSVWFCRELYKRYALYTYFFLFSSKDLAIMKYHEEKKSWDDIKRDAINNPKYKDLCDELENWALLDNEQKHWGNPWSNVHHHNISPFSHHEVEAPDESDPDDPHYPTNVATALIHRLETLDDPRHGAAAGGLAFLHGGIVRSFSRFYRTVCLWRPLAARRLPWDGGVIPAADTDQNDLAIELLAEWRPRRPSLLVLDKVDVLFEEQVKKTLKDNSRLYRHPVRLLILHGRHLRQHAGHRFKLLRTNLDRAINEITDQLIENNGVSICS